jgi:hypothetical protein
MQLLQSFIRKIAIQVYTWKNDDSKGRHSSKEKPMPCRIMKLYFTYSYAECNNINKKQHFRHVVRLSVEEARVP